MMNSCSYVLAISLWLLLFSLNTHGQELKPTETEVLIEVIVIDHNKTPLPDERISFLGRNSQKIYYVKTDDKGTAFTLLPKNDVYEVSYKELFTRKNYAVIDVPGDKGLYTYTVEIIYEPEKIFILENVYFEFGKSTLKPKSFPALNELVELLMTEKSMEIEISGHTDSIGNPEANLKLSEARAKAVRQYLIRKGIPSRRIIAVGYGDTMPVASNETEEGRQMNRRTEVKILKK